MTVHPSPNQPSARFIALMAFMFSLVAISIDMMLASLPDMGRELSPDAPQNAQLVLSVFFVSLGLATAFAGPIADAFGRRPLVLWGLMLYAIGAALSWFAPTIETMVMGRALQGFGAAAPRVAGMAVIRDRFEGSAMARTLSLVMMIFTLIPGVAPLLGEFVAYMAGWRAIFLVFMGVAALVWVWFFLQQPETLPADKHRPLRFGTWFHEVLEVLANNQTRRALFAQLFVFASLYSFLTAAAFVFDETLQLDGAFPYVIGAMSLSGAASSYLNARIVETRGILPIMRVALAVWLGICVLGAAVIVLGADGWTLRAAFIGVMWSSFLVLGLTIGNSNALAMHPMGHIAGTAAATVTSISTLGAGMLSLPVAMAFDGTARPLIIGTTCFAALALYFTLRISPSASEPQPSRPDHAL